jgi:nucleoid DNA-binding protein
MKDKVSAGDIIHRLGERSGITKKLAAETLRAIPEVIEEALLADGEARVRGLGTFRLKTVAAKKGRNPKTGEEVVIPPHQKLVFLPEESFREQANEEFRFLGIKVLEEEPLASPPSPPDPLFPLSDSERGPGGEVEPGTPGTLEPNEQVPELKPQHLNLNTNRWLIPTLFGIVAILSVVFYFRNCDSGRSSQVEVRSPEPETVSSQQSAVTSPEPETVSSQQSAVTSSEPETRNPESNEQVPELKTQNSKLKTHLFQLAREAYDGNPFLWVLIYRANPGKISNPDQVVVGSELTIPDLEGTPQKLTRTDSLNVSDGYRLVYEYYLSKGDARAAEFRQVMLKYKPE